MSCINCIYYEQCEEADDSDNSDVCAHFLDYDFFINYKEQMENESTWQEMSYRRYNQNALGEMVRDDNVI